MVGVIYLFCRVWFLCHSLIRTVFSETFSQTFSPGSVYLSRFVNFCILVFGVITTGQSWCSHILKLHCCSFFHMQSSRPSEGNPPAHLMVGASREHFCWAKMLVWPTSGLAACTSQALQFWCNLSLHFLNDEWKIQKFNYWLAHDHLVLRKTRLMSLQKEEHAKNMPRAAPEEFVQSSNSS